MMPERAAESIERVTGLAIQTCKAIRRGATSLVVEVNGEWLFRFPRGQPSWAQLEKRLRFVASFARVSPVAVPEPVYVTEHFVGYRKIAGTPLYPTRLGRLRQGDRHRIAWQLGQFLAALHHHVDPRIDFDTGYLVMRHGYHRSCPAPFAAYLTADERRKLDARLEAVADDPANLVEPTRVIHGDLYFNNILWDAESRALTGVIDWFDCLGLGVPAMDFIALADFNTRRNDRFLREILRAYGADDGLFGQIKANAIVEVLNWLWFYEARPDPKGVARTIRRLKAILNA
jgi:aminoglycoside 2''-phosphotransferase